MFTVRKVIASFLPPSHLRIARCGSRLFVIEKEGRISCQNQTAYISICMVPLPFRKNNCCLYKMLLTAASKRNARTQERHDARLSQPNLQMTHHTESFSPGVPPKRILPPFGMSTGEGGVTRNSSAPSAPSLTRCGAEGEI